jgi:CelD/BcsL family acetyltransferase involved in cellulose biosynthesis
MVTMSQGTDGEDLVVRRLTHDDHLWNKVDDDERFPVYSGSAWRAIVEDVFKFRARTMAAVRAGEIVDLLPMYHVHMPILGAKMISTPMEGCYGGFVSSDRAAHELLIRSAIDCADASNASHIEIRGQRSMEYLAGHGFTEHRPLLISQVALDSEETNWSRISSSHRRNVRISGKRGVAVRSARDPGEMRAFYRLISSHYKQLGIPFPGPVYFDRIWNVLVRPGLAELQVAEVGGRMVGGHLMLVSGSTLISKYSAALKAHGFKKFNISYALFWEAIRFGLRRGLDSFNMGVTGRDNSGLIDFKSRFGAETSDLYFYFYTRRGKPPDFSKYLDGYKTAKSAWKLAPSFVTRPVGHLINRWIC